MIVIKGEMPKGCIFDCHYFGVNKYYDERDGKTHKCIYCALNDNIRYKDCGFPDEYEHTRHPNCPIVGEIPDEHGRLVDFDEFTKSYDYGMFPNMTKEQLEYWINESIDDAKIVLEASK